MNRDEVMKFEKKLRTTFKLALVAALLHKSTAWLGAGALTWATVVLMGGFASDVAVSDFRLVTLLVVAIACLLALARFFSKLVTKKTLSTGSLDPVRLTYQDRQPGLVRKIGILSCVVQFCLILPCLCFAIKSIQRPEFKTVYFHYFKAQEAGIDPLQACLQACLISTASTTLMASCARSCLSDESDDNSNASGNLQVCLFTFFLLVIFTCSFAALCLVYVILGAKALWRLSSGSRSVSLRRYHDEVLSRALHLGLVEADEFDAKAFLLLALGKDLALRNIGPLEVKKQNADFVKYLYHHPKGVEMVHHGLVSEDTLMQQTAANMVGFWAKEPGMEKQVALLSRLAQKLGQPGKAAEGAANSFSSLAAAWAEYKQLPLLNIYCESTNTTRSRAASPRPPPLTTTTTATASATSNVVDTVIDLVLERWAPTLQVYLRALDSFFMSSSVLGSLDQNQRRRLEGKLMRIIENTDQATRSYTTTKLDMDPRTQPRTRFLAFSALFRLRGLPGDRHSPQGTSMKELLQGIDHDLKDQRFLWIQEAERYRELCTSVGITPGSWLEECQIRGKEHVD